MSPKSSQRSPASGGPNISLDDVYHIIFRQKWTILVIAVAGFLGALCLPLVWRLPYQSEAKLFIRYVLESKSPSQYGGGDPRLTEERGENVINTELEILTSLDLAQDVAASFGPEKILAKVGGGSDKQQAAAVIHARLLAEAPKKGDVIRIVFQHPDAGIVQPVLAQVIETYLKKHADIHRAVGVFDDFLTQQTDQLRSRLVQTEADLREAKAKAGVLSLQDSKKVFTEEIAKVQQEIFDAEAELAERRVTVAELTRLIHPQSSSSTNSPDATNRTNSAIPAATVAEYRKVSSALEALQKREQELLIQFTPSSSMVKPVEDQISEKQQLKAKLEDENPGLLSASVTGREGDSAANPRANLATENAKVAALEAKIKVLNNQMGVIRTNSASVDMAEGAITELQRKKEFEEAKYKYFAASLDQSRTDEAFGAGHVSNISKIQMPSPPFQDGSRRQRIRSLMFVGGFVAALGVAFLLELGLDRSLKRPSEIEPRLGIPLFISIPLIGSNGKHRLFNHRKALALLNDHNHPEADSQAVAANGESDSADTVHETPAFVHGPEKLRPFWETLRDRLINYFEIKDLTHKPKLVAVASCGEGSGVTTVAAGLAASISETGDGNVLLVDMNVQNGAAHHYYKGHLACGLDDALEREKRAGAFVHDNLYVVSEGPSGGDIPRIRRNRFHQLMPKLKASDYDYIIFDMPPISEISVTPRLARFMDFILLVVESEKSDRDVVKRGISLISDSAANVGIVLNKRRTYVPRLLQQEL